MRAPAEEALRAAFEEHYSALLRLSIALSGRRDIGEDIVQEAFVRSAGRLPSLSSGEILPYLRQVAINIWRNRVRRLAIESRFLSRKESVQPWSEQLDERADVLAALSRLPPRQRACVVLRYYADLSEREAAALLRCSVGTVKSQTSRALTKLRKDLEHED